MLTGKEQWKILQGFESRNGRGKRRKKTLAEQLVEMGGFGKDPGSEQAITEEIERDDTRAPLQYYQRSDSELEILFGETYFWESRRRLFRSWIFQAKRSRSWMQEKDLPLAFRFALGRPIMNERMFQSILRFMDLQLDESRGNARRPHTHPRGRSRALLFGIDVDSGRVHPSSKYGDILPRDAAEDVDGAREEARRIVQHDDEDVQELLRTQLWAVYEHVQNGSVPLETATWHYRDAFDRQDMSDEILVLCLQQFGIPTDHISNNEPKSPQGSARSKSPNIEESEIRISEIRNCVGLYRSGGLPEYEAIEMLRHFLVGLKFIPDDVSDVLNDLEKDEKMAASIIWEDACDEDEDADVLSSSSSSLPDEVGEPYKDHGKSLRAIVLPDPHVKDEKDQNAAGGLPVDEIKPRSRIPTEDFDNRDGFNEKESHKSKAIMGPPALPSGKRSVHSHVDKARSSVLPPSISRPASVLSVTETFDSQGFAALDREPPGDRANIGSRRTSSPDEGMTTGIWGLLMPTKEARKLAFELKLPQYAIDDQVRSISPRREKRRRSSYAENAVTLPKSKRKASTVLHKGTASKAPKYNHCSDLFASEGEGQETFVLSHFDGDKLPAVPVCDKCLRWRCDCGYESSQVNEAPQATSYTGSLSSDDPITELCDRTRAEPPKQSVPLLTYLARVLDDNDVLASIKQLEQRPKTVETFEYAKMIQDHLRQGVDAGEVLCISTEEDREVVRISLEIIESLNTLANDRRKLLHETKEEDNSTVNVNKYRGEVQEGPNLGLGLLNSSFDQENVHAPPSDDISSSAASPKKQLKVANATVFQLETTPLAKYVSAPDSSVAHLKSSSGIEDATKASRFQKATGPHSSTAGDSSRSEDQSRSPGGYKSSPAGGHPSPTKILPELPAESTRWPTADPSEQVSENSVGAVDDTVNTFGAPFTKQPHSDSQGKSSSYGEMQSSLPLRSAAREFDDNVSPQSPRARVKQSNDNSPPPSPWPPSKQSPRDVPLATSGIISREVSREEEATHRSDSSRPGLENLPLRPPQSGLPRKDRFKRKGKTFKQALNRAKKKAFSERKSLAFYLEERRAVRTRIKRENDLANSKWSDHSFFQSSNGSSGSSGTAIIQALNKLFDKYRGTSNIYLRSRTQPC